VSISFWNGNFLLLRLWQLSEQQALVPSTVWKKWAQCATRKASGFMWMQHMQVRALLMARRCIGEMINGNKIFVENLQKDGDNIKMHFRK
jgi:hypothetical protein